MQDRIGFLNQCCLRVYQDRKVILRQEEMASGLYIIAKGFVEASYDSENGIPLHLAMNTVGDALGEVEIIADLPCTASCTTYGGTELLFCPADKFLRLLHVTPLMRNVMAITHRRMGRDSAHNSKLVNAAPIVRLSLLLAQLSDDSRSEIEITQSELAMMVNFSRQTINKTIARLQDAKLITARKGRVKVLDRAGLLACAEQHY